MDGIVAHDQLPSLVRHGSNLLYRLVGFGGRRPEGILPRPKNSFFVPRYERNALVARHKRKLSWRDCVPPNLPTVTLRLVKLLGRSGTLVGLQPIGIEIAKPPNLLLNTRRVNRGDHRRRHG